MNMKPECNNARVWLKAVNLVFSSVKVALVRISVRWTPWRSSGLYKHNGPTFPSVWVNRRGRETAGRPRNHRRLPTTAEAPAAVCVLAYSSTPERHLR